MRRGVGVRLPPHLAQAIGLGRRQWSAATLAYAYEMGSRWRAGDLTLTAWVDHLSAYDQAHNEGVPPADDDGVDRTTESPGVGHLVAIESLRCPGGQR